MTLQEQLQAVKDQLSQLDGNNRDHLADISKLTAKETELTNQIALEEAEQQRILVQEEKVESISLPYNFSEVFDDPRADEMIIELIKEFQRKAYAEHNQEVSELVAAHREELTKSADRELELKRQIDELSVNLEGARKEHITLDTEITELEQKIVSLHYELSDAESKRDAAVAEKEGIETLLVEKQSHIDKLRDEIAIGAVAAVNVVEISPTDRLAKLIEESKQAKVKSAVDIALENTVPFRGKVIPEGQVVAQLNAPEAATFQIVDQTGNPISGVDTTESVSVPAEDQVAFREEGEVHPEPSTVDQGNSGVEVAGKTLEERVKALELHVFGA